MVRGTDGTFPRDKRDNHPDWCFLCPSNAGPQAQAKYFENVVVRGRQCQRQMQVCGTVSEDGEWGRRGGGRGSVWRGEGLDSKMQRQDELANTCCKEVENEAQQPE